MTEAVRGLVSALLGTAVAQTHGTPRRASVDDVVSAFEDAIGRWVGSHSKDLARIVGEDGVSAAAERVADQIYHEVEIDPAHLQRFVRFYVNDVRLLDALDELAAYGPGTPAGAPA